MLALADTYGITSACSSFSLFFFFFQAEDGIRDLTVTGVQTCALPIFIGVNVRDTTADTRIVRAKVMANSRKSLPTTSPINNSGMSTAISDTVSERIVKPICLDPFNAACIGDWPSSTYREMFSIMTTASSTTKPVDIVKAISVRLFRLNPIRYISPKAPTSDKGTATLGITVAATFRRKMNMTITTSPIVSMSSNSTSATDERIVVVRSVRIDTSTDEGKDALSCGNRALIRSTTAMMFAPGWR